jgi:hypothetical protein
MSTHDRRLDRLTQVYRQPDPKHTGAWDYSALSLREQFELDQLLRWDEPTYRGDAPARPMTPTERERLTELLDRVDYRPPMTAS